MSIGLTKEQQEYLLKEKTEEDTKSGLTQRVEQLEIDIKMLHDLLFRGLDEDICENPTNDV